jgi:hypothetical protein
MRILFALIAVFITSSAVALMPTTVQKVHATTSQVIGEVERRPTFQ